MGKLVGVLLPWRNTFRRLELEKHWWHRLATVLFFAALIPTLLYSWVIGDDGNSPPNSSKHNINYWMIGPTTPIPPAPDGSQGVPNPNYVAPDAGVQIDPSTIQPLAIPIRNHVAPDSKDLRKTIEMPDGKTATYPGTTSDEVIEAEWKHKLNIATAKAALFGFGIALLVGVLLSYLLQAAYRALVYVIYGAKARAAPGGPVAG